MNIADTKILITGAGKGIGNFIATGLLNEAAKVFIVDNDEAALSAIPQHKNLQCFHCELTNADAVEKLITEIFELHGGVNVCINNAGVIHSEPLINFLSKADKKHSIQNWNKVMDVNLNAVFYVTANVAERMVANRARGIIINISSIAAQGNIGQSAYAASKAAVEALTKTWSKELGMFKIRCACIAPGFFNTVSTRDSLSEAMLSKWEKAVPLARLGQIEELLSSVKFIIENDYFNGKVLALDGGLTL